MKSLDGLTWNYCHAIYDAPTVGPAGPSTVLHMVRDNVPPKPRYRRRLTGRMAALSAKIFLIMALYRL